MRPYLLSESNWNSIQDQTVELAVLPWGATEAHNYHLPYATDNYQVSAIAAEAGRIAWESDAKVMVLPTIPFGVNTGQTDIRLNMNIYPSTQAAILNDVTEVLNRHEIHKLLVLNGHGGNNFKPLIRELGVKYPNMFLALGNWFQAADKSEFFDHPQGDHADEMETSLMLYLEEHLVLPLKQAGAGEEKKYKIAGLREKWAWAERRWSEVTEDTGVGNPKEANADKGEDYFKVITQEVGKLFIDLARADLDNLYE